MKNRGAARSTSGKYPLGGQLLKPSYVAYNRGCKMALALRRSPLVWTCRIESKSFSGVNLTP